MVLEDSGLVIAAGHNEVFGDDPFSILVSEAHIRNQRRTNNRHERYNSTPRRMVSGRRGRLSRMGIGAVCIYYIRTHMGLGDITPAERHGRDEVRHEGGPHMGLGDITPAEKAGMSIMDPNKLLTLNAMSKMAVPHPQWTRNLEKACQAA